CWRAVAQSFCSRSLEADVEAVVGPWSSVIRLPQQGRGGPQHRRLAMEVSRLSRATQVIFEIIFLSRAHTDISDIGVLIYITHQGEPSLSRCRAVSFFIQPAILYTCNQGKGEHSGGRGFWPSFGMID